MDRAYISYIQPVTFTSKRDERCVLAVVYLTIIWSNTDVWSIEPTGTYATGMLIKMQQSSYKKMNLKMTANLIV